MTDPDVVYPYRQTYKDRDLRYSLRSLCNVPHGKVIVAGDKPRLPGVVHVPVGAMRNRYMSSTANILAALRKVSTPDVIVMHDDIFVMCPWAYVHQDRGLLSEYLSSNAARGSYGRMLERTHEILQAHGVDDPVFYSLHTPVVYDASKLEALIEEFGSEAASIRTIYWNLHPQPSETADDVKVRKMSSAIGTMPIISTTDELSRSSRWRRWIDRKFPKPSQYE